jgi:hypothetical protein
MGMDLATMTSAVQLQEVCNDPNVATPNGFWLGATDIEAEATFKWVNGWPWTFNSWGSNEPNNKDGNENCLELSCSSKGSSLFSFSFGTWNDIACSVKSGFLCSSALPLSK